MCGFRGGGVPDPPPPLPEICLVAIFRIDDLPINNGKLTLFLAHVHEPKAQVQYYDHAFFMSVCLSFTFDTFDFSETA